MLPGYDRLPSMTGGSRLPLNVRSISQNQTRVQDMATGGSLGLASATDVEKIMTELGLHEGDLDDVVFDETEAPQCWKYAVRQQYCIIIFPFS